MNKHFNLCIDGWFINNNEIPYINQYERCNLLDISYRLNEKYNNSLKIDSIKKEKEINFIIIYNGKEKVLDLSSISEVEDFLNTHLHGANFIEDKETKCHYFPLQITAGWRPMWNHLVISKDKSKKMPTLDSECYIQDIACFAYKADEEDYLLDIGYPEGTVNSDFYLELIKAQDWGNPLISYQSRDINDIIIRINEVFHDVTYKSLKTDTIVR